MTSAAATKPFALQFEAEEVMPIHNASTNETASL